MRQAGEVTYAGTYKGEWQNSNTLHHMFFGICVRTSHQCFLNDFSLYQQMRTSKIVTKGEWRGQVALDESLKFNIVSHHPFLFSGLLSLHPLLI